MSRINGVHHLAISTADIKGQIRFFSQVLGMRLLAFYWMHGVEGAWHAFLELNERSSLALVAMPGIAEGEVKLGSSHAAHGGAPSAPGTMQHISLRVETSEDLIALRNRIRSHGVPVIGPIDHGMCQSMYFAGPEGLNLEIATSDSPLDADAWIDPEVVALAGVSAEELAAFTAPALSPPAVPALPQPPYDPGVPHMAYPDDMYRKMLATPDEKVWARSSHTEPPVRRVTEAAR